MSIAFADLLDLLHEVSEISGTDGWSHQALCPAHEDGSPSLRIKDGEERIGLKCWSGCQTAEIVLALGLEPKHLWKAEASSGKSAAKQGSADARPGAKPTAIEIQGLLSRGTTATYNDADTWRTSFVAGSAGWDAVEHRWGVDAPQRLLAAGIVGFSEATFRLMMMFGGASDDVAHDLRLVQGRALAETQTPRWFTPGSSTAQVGIARLGDSGAPMVVTEGCSDGLTAFLGTPSEWGVAVIRGASQNDAADELVALIGFGRPVVIVGDNDVAGEGFAEFLQSKFDLWDVVSCAPPLGKFDDLTSMWESAGYEAVSAYFADAETRFLPLADEMAHARRAENWLGAQEQLSHADVLEAFIAHHASHFALGPSGEPLIRLDGRWEPLNPKLIASIMRGAIKGQRDLLLPLISEGWAKKRIDALNGLMHTKTLEGIAGAVATEVSSGRAGGVRRLNGGAGYLATDGGTKVVSLETGEVVGTDPAKFGLVNFTDVVWPGLHSKTEHWDGFLRRILPDTAKRRAFQEFVGYSIWGKPQHNVMYGIVGPGGTGKRVPFTTPVLTPNGWVAAGDVRVGDALVGSDGKATEVLAVYPNHTPRPTYRVRVDDGGEVLCDDEHLWTVRSQKDRKQGKPGRTFTTAELLKSGLKLTGTDGYRWALPVLTAVVHPEADLPISPYLVGALIADGSLASSTSVSFTSSVSGYVKLIGASLPDSWTIRQSRTVPLPLDLGGSVGWTIRSETPGEPQSVLRELGLWGCRSSEKRIPAALLTAGIDQRLALLRGLMDGDGTIKDRGQCSYSTTSEGLAADVQQLVWSLGGWAKVNASPDRVRSYNGKPAKTYRGEIKVTVRMPEGMCPFDLPEKAVKWAPAFGVDRRIVAIERVEDTPGVCFRVSADDHLFVVKDYLVTHNTAALETIAKALGSYATMTSEQLLLGKAHEAEGASLYGRRFVFTDDGVKTTLSSDQIKKLASVGTMRARRLYCDPFNFETSHVLAFQSNFTPQLDRHDTGTLRRLLVIVFDQKKKAGDGGPGNLMDLIEAELPGILAWCVRGAVGYSQQGRALVHAAALVEATSRLISGSDKYAEFVEKCSAVAVDNEGRVPNSEVRRAWFESFPDDRKTSEASAVPFNTLTSHGWLRGASPGKDGRYMVAPAGPEGNLLYEVLAHNAAGADEDPTELTDGEILALESTAPAPKPTSTDHVVPAIEPAPAAPQAESVTGSVDFEAEFSTHYEALIESGIVSGEDRIADLAAYAEAAAHTSAETGSSLDADRKAWIDEQLSDAADGVAVETEAAIVAAFVEMLSHADDQ